MIAGGSEQRCVNWAWAVSAPPALFLLVTTIRFVQAGHGIGIVMVLSFQREPRSWCWRTAVVPEAWRTRVCAFGSYGVSADAYHITSPK